MHLVSLRKRNRQKFAARYSTKKSQTDRREEENAAKYESHD